MFKQIKLFANRIFLLIKLAIIIFIALIIPRFFLFSTPNPKPSSIAKVMELPVADPKFKLGLENISEKLTKKLKPLNYLLRIKLELANLEREILIFIKKRITNKSYLCTGTWV